MQVRKTQRSMWEQLLEPPQRHRGKPLAHGLVRGRGRDGAEQVL